MKYPSELSGMELGGIYVHEPGALISNLAIAFSCLVICLLHLGATGKFQKRWTLFVICIGLGAAGGSVVHGFPTHVGEEGFYWLWAIKNSFVPLANFFALSAIFGRIARKRKVVFTVLASKAIIAIALLFITYSFLPAVVDLAITYILVILITRKFAEAIPGSKIFFSAFLIALLSGVFYLFRFSFFEGFFTEKDLVHVFVVLSLIIIHRGIRQAEKEEVFFA